MLSYNAGTLPNKNPVLDSAATYGGIMSGYFANLNAVVMPIENWEPIPMTDHSITRVAPSGQADGTFAPAPDPVPVDAVIDVHTTCKVEPIDDVQTTSLKAVIAAEQ